MTGLLTPLSHLRFRARLQHTVLVALSAAILAAPLPGQTNTFPLSGNVGIGTSAPGAQLHLMRLDDTYGVNNLKISSNGDSTKFGFADASSAYNVMRLGYWTGSGFGSVVIPNGNVGIGTTNPQHLLHVAGTIGAEEVLVTSNGADYVFQPGYRLRPLSEIAKYIEANHHLPDIPSTAEVKQRGMGVGEMEAKLLAKIEELTLHMIQADERNNRLEKQNQDLHDRIAHLEAQPAR